MTEFSFEEQVKQPDFDARMEAFIEALMHETSNDDEPWSKKGYHLAKALAENKSEDVLIAICGWSPSSIAKKALIIPDEHEEFWDRPVDGEFIIQWDDGSETVCDCTINPKTFEVTVLNDNVFNPYVGTPAVDHYEVSTAPVLDLVTFHCIPGSQRRKENNAVAFWFEDCAGPGGKLPAETNSTSLA